MTAAKTASQFVRSSDGSQLTILDALSAPLIFLASDFARLGRVTVDCFTSRPNDLVDHGESYRSRSTIRRQSAHAADGRWTPDSSGAATSFGPRVPLPASVILAVGGSVRDQLQLRQ
jgi:hypothetical protein